MATRRDAIRTNLEELHESDLQETVFDCFYNLAENEANDGECDPNDVYNNAEYDASLVCNEGREAMIEWVTNFELGLNS